METVAAKLLVLVEKNVICIKIIGRADFNSSLDFRTLIVELRARGYTQFVIDLSECMLMDSTFLGVLAGCALKLNAEAVNGKGQMIELLNPNPRITELLENLGMLPLFKVCDGEAKKAEAMRPAGVVPAQPSREEVTRNCLEAHKTLMAINPENVNRFKDVARFLADDLQKMQAKS